MNYDSKTKKNYPIIILHGWGLRGSAYKDIEGSLKKEGYKVYAIDLPGFGAEPLGKKVMTLADYVTFVDAFIQKKKLKKVILLGHSFGGRVSIKFAVTFTTKVSAIILTGAPGIKRKLSFFRQTVRFAALCVGEIFRISALSGAKKIMRKGLYFIIGEWDYYNAGDLRETFKKVIGEDLSPLLSSISVPTLLVWGNNDMIVPVVDGYAMKNLIPKARLVVINDRGHKLPYEAPSEFLGAIEPFLNNI